LTRLSGSSSQASSTTTSRIYSGYIECWSEPLEEIQLTDEADNKAFRDIVVSGIPANSTIIRVNLTFRVRIVSDSSQMHNALDGDQNIQVRKHGTGTWTDAINLKDDMFTTPGGWRDNGMELTGDEDIKSEVDGNGTYNVRWENAICDNDNLEFNDVEVGLMIWFTT